MPVNHATYAVRPDAPRLQLARASAASLKPSDSGSALTSAASANDAVSQALRTPIDVRIEAAQADGHAAGHASDRISVTPEEQTRAAYFLGSELTLTPSGKQRAIDELRRVAPGLSAASLSARRLALGQIAFTLDRLQQVMGRLQAEHGDAWAVYRTRFAQHSHRPSTDDILLSRTAAERTCDWTRQSRYGAAMRKQAALRTLQSRIAGRSMTAKAGHAAHVLYRDRVAPVMQAVEPLFGGLRRVMADI